MCFLVPASLQFNELHRQLHEQRHPRRRAYTSEEHLEILTIQMAETIIIINICISTMIIFIMIIILFFIMLLVCSFRRPPGQPGLRVSHDLSYLLRE